MQDNVNCFFAYSSDVASICETIEESISSVNDKKTYLHIKSWTDMSINGKYIIDTICSEIDNSDVFICELTNLNQNVLFELGYSVAKQKKIVIFLDKTFEKSAQLFDSFGLLTTIGYTNYTNSNQMTEGLFSEDYSKLNSTLIENSIENLLNDNKQVFLYLRSLHETDASMRLTKTINSHINGNVTIDDPDEIRIQTLSWYIQHIICSYGVIAHFESDSKEGHILHNAKLAFVCGTAFGLKTPLLMLAQEPYKTPIDYRDILKLHDTASKCASFATEWFQGKKEDFEECRKTPREISSKELRARSELQKLYLGDIIAENDLRSIDDYFIKTAAYDEALRSNHSIFVGRKGCGKTANLIKLASELNTSDHHVCVIKPINYEFAGILDLLTRTEKKAERGYLVESLWKYLIYTEVLKSVYDTLIKKPIHFTYTEKENAILEYVKKNPENILTDFSSRLEMAVTELSDADIYENTVKQKEKISELLHKNSIGIIRTLLGDYFYPKKDVIILIDNLDKPWIKHMNIELISEFLFGLLDVGYSLIKDFSRADSKHKPTNISLHIFLRDDIYHRILQYAPEKDKLPVKKIVWDDKDTLLGVIETRMTEGENINIWNKYFCTEVCEVDVKEYIYSTIIPKPRDIILFTKEAIALAVNRKHSKIESEDIMDAEKEYSKYAFDTLLVETTDQDFDFENLLYGFLGIHRYTTHSEIEKIIKDSGLDVYRTDEIIDLLCYLSFLGLEVQKDRFEFVYDEEVFKKYKIMSEKTALNSQQEKRYLIHKAFCRYLEIES
jgi:hypothetical protein